MERGKQVEDEGDEEWFFKDHEGKAHGPLRQDEMREKYRLGLLSLHTPVSRKSEGPFARVGSFFRDTEFIFIGKASQPEEHELIQNDIDDWYYRDLEGSVHGPFSSNQMREWVLDGTFDKTIEVRSGADSDFAMLQDMFPDMTKAFTTSRGVDRRPIRISTTSPYAGFGAQQFSVAEPSPAHGMYSGSFHDSNSKDQRSGKSFRSKIGSGTQQVKSKLFSRVSKHRRSNSAGSNVDMRRLVMEDPGEGMVGTTPTGASRGPVFGNVSHSASSGPLFTSTSGSGKSSSSSKFTGKKLLSVVTTPKYSSKASFKVHKSFGISRSEKTERTERENGDATTGESASQNYRRLASLAAKYGHRSLYKKKKRGKNRKKHPEGEGEGETDDENDEELDEDEDDDDDDSGDLELDDEVIGTYRDDSSDSDEEREETRRAKEGDKVNEVDPTASRGSDRRRRGAEGITDDIHARLNYYWNRRPAASALYTSEEEKLGPRVAELQDENAQLRAYIRQMKAVIGEKAPELYAHLPPPPAIHMRASSQHFSQSTGPKDVSFKDDTVGSSQNANSTAQSSEEEALWEKFVVVEFDEDSPMLRRKVTAYEEGTEALRGDIKELIKTSCAYRDVCSEELDAMRAFQDDLALPEIRKMSPLIPLFHSMLHNIQEFKSTVLDSLELNLIASMDDFLKKDIKETQIRRRELQRARDVFETLEAKYMHHRRTKVRTGVIGNVGRAHDAVEEQMFNDLQSAKAKFELARFALVQQINQLESKKRFVVVDRVATCLNDYLNYFRRGYQMMANYAATIEDNHAELAGTQGKFDEMVEKWNEKRMQLEAQVHSGAFPFMSKERRKQQLYTKGNEKVTVHSRTSRANHDPLVIHEGYLYKRSTSVRKDWKRRWFVLRSDQLLYYRRWKDPIPQPVCDILLCTVREVKNPELRCCFEIISPNKRAYMLQAVNEFEMKTWMDAIRKAIECSLNKQPQRPSISRSSGLADPEVALLLSLNPTCADCGAADPEWVSLNLGVVVCITCSGIHRSLGVHISKVRSVALDQLPRSQLQLLRRLGNGTMNSMLEALIPPLEHKPGPNAERQEREAFIRAKYVDKSFMDRSRFLSDNVQSLFEAVAENDIECLMQYVLQGFPLDVCGAHDPCDLPDHSTALHVAAALGHGDCAELLLLNGASFSLRNEAGETAFQVAQRLDQQLIMQILERYSSMVVGASHSPSPLSTHSPKSFPKSKSAPTSPVMQ